MSDPNDALLQALSVSPDNVPLRAHVVEEFLRARRYRDLRALAEPLLETDKKALGLLAMARAEHASGRSELAKEHY